MRRTVFPLAAALALGASLACAEGPPVPHVPAPAAAANARVVDVLPGGVVRWPGEAIALCGDEHETWKPRDGACYYPVDLDRGEALFPVFRDRAGKRETASVRVLPPPYATESLRVDPRTVRVSEKVRRRTARERRQVVPLFSLRTSPSFSLPLAPPLAEAPPARNFGVRRLFNGEPRSAHGGVDYRAKAGTPILATEGGLVVLAAHHFFAGKNVFVDHGAGLLSIYMHLSRIDVKAGQRVARGERLGLSGATGRVTGPHLHFGFRWRGARVDPNLLLADPATLPSP
ncbi:MAG: M23 family metallopeptidase [Thermoanaerobaculia bacterium]